MMNQQAATGIPMVGSNPLGMNPYMQQMLQQNPQMAQMMMQAQAQQAAAAQAAQAQQQAAVNAQDNEIINQLLNSDACKFNQRITRYSQDDRLELAPGGQRSRNQDQRRPAKCD